MTKNCYGVTAGEQLSFKQKLSKKVQYMVYIGGIYLM